MTAEPCEAVVADLSAFINRRLLPCMSSQNRAAPRIYLLASLARACRLLCGTVFLAAESPFEDLAASFSRQIVECWLLGVFLFLAPDEALGVLNAKHVGELKRLSKHGWDGLEEAIEWMESIPGANLDWRSVATRVNALLQNSPYNAVGDSIRVYDVLYRSESLVNSHSGLSSLQLHIDAGQDATYTLEKARTPHSAWTSIKPVAVLTALLAVMVCDAIGFDATEAVKIFQRLLTCTHPDLERLDETDVG